jgi:3-methyladenine DNA glycosylase AlkD
MRTDLPEVGVVLQRIRAMENAKAVADMMKAGIQTRKAYGLSSAQLRKLAKELGRDHRLAQELWATGVHDARILAALIDEPDKVSERQMDRWARDFDNYVIGDTCCTDLFWNTPYAYRRALAWTQRPQEFVKRAGFALIAEMAIHDKKAEDSRFLTLLGVVKQHATDERVHVKKAVASALRQIGARNPKLKVAAAKLIEEMKLSASPSVRWVAADAAKKGKPAAAAAPA